MTTVESRGHLYGTAPRRVIGVPALIGLFTLSFAVLVLAMGIAPVNLMLARMVAPSMVTVMWRNSMNQLAVRALVAALACLAALAITGRARGPLTGSGMLAVGAITSGALAGAIDIGVHKLWVRQMIQAYHASKLYGTAFSLGMTAAVAFLLTLLLVTRRMRIATAQ